MSGHCTCQHPRSVHRRGVGRCLAQNCRCLFAPPSSPRPHREPPARGRVTVDGNGTVLDFQPPTPEQKRLAAHARLSEREKLERALARRIALAGLPEPVRQYYWAKPERLFRSDFAYPQERVLLECQGGIWASDPGRHNRGSGYERDLSRSNLAAIKGWKLLAFSERMITSGEAIASIERALGRVVDGSQLPLVQEA